MTSQERVRPGPVGALAGAFEGVGVEGAIAAAGALLLALASTGRVEVGGAFGIRLAVLLVLTALGLPLLVTAAVNAKSPATAAARGAVAFLVVGAISAAISTAPDPGFFGYFYWGTGWLFFLGLAAAWAIGAATSARGAELLGKAIVAVGALNAVAVLLEVVGLRWTALGASEAHWPDVYITGGQPYGTMENPVYAAQLLAGAIGILAYRCERRTPWWWAGVVGLSGASVLVGERFVPVILVVLVAWAVVARGAKSAAMLAGGFVAGYVGGYVFQLALSAGANLRGLHRIASTGGAFGARVEEWKAALKALPHHFLLGVGPSETRSVTTRLLPLVDSRVQTFTDVHNLVLEVLLTTGIVGAICAIAWIWPTLRVARGPLALCALVLLAGGLTEPLNITVTSLALLALGAAMSYDGETARYWSPVLVRIATFDPFARWRRAPEPSRAAAVKGAAKKPPASPGRPASERGAQPQVIGALVAGRSWTRLLGIVLCIPALIYGLSVTVGVSEYFSGVAGDLSALTSSVNRLSVWSAPSQRLGVDYLSGANTKNGRTYVQDGLSWSELALSKDKTDAATWGTLGLEELILGNKSAAQASFEEALYWDPAAADGYRGFAFLAIERNDLSALVTAYRGAAAIIGTPKYQTALACLVKAEAAHSTIRHTVATCINPTNALAP